ncbi:MAG: delta-aminolevulinic acid dehydratase, partial [Pseudomonadota bacterium]
MTIHKSSLLRLKQNQYLRDLCDGTSFSEKQLIQPLFVVESVEKTEPIPGLGDNSRLSLDASLVQIEKDIEAGVRQFIIFFVPKKQTAKTFNTDYSTAAMQEISKRFAGSAHFWVDACLCSSLDTGHCCVHKSNGQINLQASLELLSKLALELGQAGAGGIAPSDM